MGHSSGPRRANPRSAAGRWAVLLGLVALTCVGCGSTRPDAGSTATPSTPVPAHCAPPVPTRHPPHVLPSDGRWFGHDGVWIDVSWTRDPRGVIAGDQGPGVVAAVKYATVTLLDGRFTSVDGPPTIIARELGSGRTARAERGGYASTDTLRWWPTVVAFPATGCWEVHTTWRDRTVRFRVPLH